MIEQAAHEHPPIHKELQTAVRHSLVYGLGSVAAKAISFLMVPFYTHYLSPADYGVLEILDLTVSLCGMFLNMGITTALLQAHAAAKTAADKRTVASTALLGVILTGILTILMSISAAKPLSAMLLGPGVPSRYLLLSLAAFALNYISNLPGTYIRALEKSGWFATLEVSVLVFSLGLNIVFIAVFKLGLFGVLLSSALTAALQAVVLTGWMLSRVGITFRGGVLRQLMNYGMPLILSNAALFTLNFSDRYFLQHFRSLSDVGVYAVGYKFGFTINYLLVLPFSSMWQARMYIVHQRPDHAKIFGQVFVLYSILLTYAALGLAMFSSEVVRLMVDPQFSAAEPVVAIVAGAYALCGIAYCARTGTFVTGKTGVLASLSVAIAILNLTLNWVLIPRAGMLGAAWATLASFAALAAVNYWFSQRVIRLPLGIWRVVSALALACGLYLVPLWWSPAQIGPAIAFKSALLLLFPLLLWKGGLLSAAEMETVSAFAGVLKKRQTETETPVDERSGLIPGSRAMLQNRAREWNMPDGDNWRALFNNNYRPNYSTIHLLWFHGRDRFPRVAIKVFTRPDIPTREFDNLKRAHAAAPALVPRPLHFGRDGRFWTLWMEGLPGNLLDPRSAASRGQLASVAQSLASIHIGLRQTSAHPDRHRRMVVDPLAALQNYGESQAVRAGCAQLTAECSADWLSGVPTISQHGDLATNNVLAHRGEFRVLDWESLGEIDLPFYDLLTFLLSVLRAGGETPSLWNSAVITQVPSLLQRYARSLELSVADVNRLLPLTMANWFYLHWTDGRDEFCARLYRVIEHYFEYTNDWKQVFIGSGK